MHASARVLASFGGWYEAWPKPSRNCVVYKVIRQFDELTSAELI